MLTREQILSLTTLPGKEIDVPAWGGKLRIRKFSGRDRFDFEQLMVQTGISDVGLATAALVVGVVDAEGNRLFTKDDVEAMGALDADTLIEVGREVLAFNGIINQAASVEAAGNV